MATSIKMKFFISCAQCEKDFGGPDAGEFDIKHLTRGVNQILELLLAEAMAMNWITLQYGSDDVLLCSPKCVSEWLSPEEINRRIDNAMGGS